MSSSTEVMRAARAAGLLCQRLLKQQQCHGAGRTLASQAYALFDGPPHSLQAPEQSFKVPASWDTPLGRSVLAMSFFFTRRSELQQGAGALDALSLPCRRQDTAQALQSMHMGS